MAALAILSLALMGACALTGFVCAIVVFIRVCRESIALGCLALFWAPFLYTYGWVKAGEYGIKKVMLLWTLSLAGMVLFLLVAFVLSAASAQ